MDNQNQDAPEVLETPEEVAEETPEETTPEREAPQVDKEKEELKARLEELEKKNRQLYERAKKIEKQNDGLSNKDLLYLAKADIPAEDVDEVITYARKMGTSIVEAHNFFKPILQVRTEERRTANATQVKGNRGTAKMSGEDLLQKVERTGEIPDNDEAMRLLAEARMARRSAQNKR